MELVPRHGEFVMDCPRGCAPICAVTAGASTPAQKPMSDEIAYREGRDAGIRECIALLDRAGFLSSSEMLAKSIRDPKDPTP